MPLSRCLKKTLPRDGPEIGSFQDFHNGVLNAHSTVNPLFNPFAWGSLIRSISEGDKSRSADNTTNNSGTSTTSN